MNEFPSKLYFSVLLEKFLSLTLRDIFLLLSKHLAYPIIQGSIINNGLMLSLSLYPMKNLNDFLLPQSSLLETNILLASRPGILNTFLFL